MTRSSGVHSPQSAKSRQSAAYCKQYASLPDNAPKILTKDSVYINHPAAAWPQGHYERRRLFQDVYNKYFQQIIYGCENSKCDTPTCLSHQKRLSKGPFRRFTVLSARTLATFLASQDNPEKGLCPFEPNGFSEPLHRGPLTRHQSDTIKANYTAFQQITSVSGSSTLESELEATDGHPPELRRNTQDREVEITPSRFQRSGVSSTTHALQHEGSRIEKDWKSFTQNLFDTIAMVVLQKARVPNELGLSKWAAWIRGEEGNAPCKGCNTKALPTGKESAKDISGCHLPNGNGGNYYDSSSTGSTTGDKSEFMSGAAMKASSECDEERSSPLDGREVRSSMSESDGKTCKGTCKGSIAPSCTSQDSLRDPHILPSSQSFKDDHGPLISTIPNSIRPQALSRFTSENITSMVSVIKSAGRAVHEERQFRCFLGRAEEPINATAFVRGNATPQDMIVAYGLQSITNVLGSTKALLRSFRCSPSVKSSISTIQSVGFKEISGAFRTLKEIDYHPSSIFPSLWYSIGSLYLPGPVRSKSQVGKTYSPMRTRDSDSEYRLQGKQFESRLTETDRLNDAEAVHVVKIALAALVASVPLCSSKAWLYIQSLRASGKVAPITKGPPKSPGTINGLFEIIDSLDNELSLALMTRLVKAIAARLCVSEISKSQGLCSSKVAHQSHHQQDILEMILDSVSDSDNTSSLSDPSLGVLGGVQDPILDSPHNLWANQTSEIPSLCIIVEWLRTVILREWDGKAEVPRWGAVGGALEFMSSIYRHCQRFRLDPEIFRTPSLTERFDVMEMPAEWLSAPSDRRVVHILSYPFLFRPSTLVSCFRSINHAAMAKAFEASVVTARLLTDMSATDPINGRDEHRLSVQIRRALNSYLVLEIRRDRVLTDAMDQLWRRERRELLRPLKVRMGMEEGEEGVDHGGVQQEFFRMAIGEALNPDYGLFQTDVRTRTAWFQPCALEPLYKFEMLGLLSSLAIYNGLTLPITFPLALYRKLLDLPVTGVAHIEDGWPDLAKGFKELLSWTDGDVEDVFVRSYVFSIEGLGSTIHVDMDRTRRDDDWPLISDHKGKGKSSILDNHSASLSQSSARATYQRLGSPCPSNAGLDDFSASQRFISSSEDPWPQESSRRRTNSIKSEAGMVTNANRQQYVEDCVFWLTDKSIRPQFEAFARGFYVCLDRKATTIFTPEALKSVVEGIQEIDIDALQQTTRYEGGFSPDHRVVKDFWHVVRQFSPEKLRLLLEFVTASDRIPVNGVRSILFVIQQNGVEDERLPTSLTCFGRLLLPAYSSRKKLKEKLCAAIENSKGFGVA